MWTVVTIVSSPGGDTWSRAGERCRELWVDEEAGLRVSQGFGKRCSPFLLGAAMVGFTTISLGVEVLWRIRSGTTVSSDISSSCILKRSEKWAATTTIKDDGSGSISWQVPCIYFSFFFTTPRRPRVGRSGSRRGSSFRLMRSQSRSTADHGDNRRICPAPFVRKP